MNAIGRFVLILWICLLASGCASSASNSSGTAAAPALASTPVNATASATANTPANAPAATLDAPSTPAASPTNAPTAVTTATQSAAPAPANTPQSATAAATVAATTPSASVPSTGAQTFPDPAAYTWTQVASGINRPTDIAFIPDNTGRFLVLGQQGTVRIFQNGQMLPDYFLNIVQRVGSTGNEQGLLGIALHPLFLKNGYFYVNYTDKNGNTVIARYNLMENNPNQADPNSEKVLLRVDQPFANHNGGSMAFGPDGFLYMGLGDGGSAGDPYGHGQSLDTYLAKILRVDVNQGDPYAIPPTNPFAKGGGKPEIWAYGLRNPWRFSFDRQTGDFYIGDVGQDQWEEIDFLPAGSPGGTDFGWNIREGKHPYKGSPPADANLTDPVYDYAHGFGCSVSGGFVYRGQALPEFQGIYLFADYCSGRIWGLLRGAGGAWQAKQLYQDKWNITSFGQDNSGEIYFLDQGSGGVYKLQRK